jgi:hypothetical protein
VDDHLAQHEVEGQQHDPDNQGRDRRATEGANAVDGSDEQCAEERERDEPEDGGQPAQRMENADHAADARRRLDLEPDGGNAHRCRHSGVRRLKALRHQRADAAQLKRGAVRAIFDERRVHLDDRGAELVCELRVRDDCVDGLADLIGGHGGAGGA